MSAQNPPKKAQAYSVYVQLPDFAIPGAMKASPTLAAGDFKVAIDGGTLNNLGTLPTVGPAASTWILITLSAAEMTGDNIQVQCIDTDATREWSDVGFCVQTTT
jgi:hypothetical protein